jgi:hypothetical protein
MSSRTERVRRIRWRMLAQPWVIPLSLVLSAGCPLIVGGPDLSNVDQDRLDGGGDERLTEIEPDSAALEATADTATTPPPWDWCADGAFEGDPGRAFGATSGADDTFTPSCAPSVAPDTALVFVAPLAGTYRFTTTEASFNPVLTVLDGCDGDELACNDDAVGTQSRAMVELEEGQAVIVVVDGFGSGSGSFTVESRWIPPEDCTNHVDDDLDREIDCFDPDCTLEPACDPACPEHILQEVPGELLGSTVGLTDDSTPPCGYSLGASDVSVAFTAPADGSYVFDTVGSTYDTMLYARDGCGGPSLGCNDDYYGLQSRLVVELAAGQTALLVVDGYNQSSGDYVLHVWAEGACADGIDDDGDGDVDCADRDCAADTACAAADTAAP